MGNPASEETDSMGNSFSGAPDSFRRRGFTLLEVLIAASVALIALCGLLAAISNSMLVTQQNREYALAMEAARDKIEELRNMPFKDVFAAYNEVTGDDPSSAPGADFAVDGLSALDTDPDGQAGKIIFPTSAAQPGLLDETITAQQYGVAANLDMNGNGTNTDVFDPATISYVVLPVTVRIEWKGAGGASRFEIRSILLRQ